MEMKFLEARLGDLEERDHRMDVSPSESISNIKKALKNGFHELTSDEFEIELAYHKRRLSKLIIDTVKSDGKMFPWEDLRLDEGKWLTNNPAAYLSVKMRNFCVYDKPYESRGDLKLSFDSQGPNPQTSTRNLIFNQGVTIDGNLDAGDFTEELPLYLVVKGDLRAKNLILTGWAEIVVTGNIILDGIVVALDGEPGGRLHVHGNLNSKEILGGMMYYVKVDGQVNSNIFWCDDDEAPLPNASIVSSTISNRQFFEFEKLTPLVKDAYHENTDRFSGEDVRTLTIIPSQIVELVRQGKSVFRSK